MYKIGDLIIYGNTGVCLVDNITTMKFSEASKGTHDKKFYYVLKPLYESETIYTPIDNDKIFMRPIISSEEADKMIDMIPLIEAEAYYSSNLQELRNHYQEATTTYNCSNLIELIMSIYAKKQSMEKQTKQLGQVDKKFMKQAEEMLHGEFAVALGINKDEVPSYIAARVNSR